MNRGTKPRDLSTLQAGRGIAALLVLLHHASVIFAAPKYWSSEILGGFFGFGFSGVEFFFVLSGFIMVYVNRNKFGNPSEFFGYFRKRILRIYPIYWIVTAIVFSIYAVSKNDNSSLLLNSIILIGYDNDAIISVSWTLFHEICFYIIFSSIIFSRNAGIVLLSTWSFLCMLWFNQTPPHYALSSINLLFGFGIVAALLSPRLPFPRFLLILGVIGFAGMGFEADCLKVLTSDERNMGFGLAAAVIVGAAAKAESAGSIKSPRWMSFLGDGSYSLYLIHYPLLAAIAKIWSRTPLRSMPVGAAFALVVSACVAAGLLTHMFVEVPLIERLRKRAT